MTGKINSFHFNSQNLTPDEDLQFYETAYGSKKFQNYYNKFYFILTQYRGLNKPKMKCN